MEKYCLQSVVLKHTGFANSGYQMLRHTCIVQSFLPAHLPTTITSHRCWNAAFRNTFFRGSCKHNIIHEGESSNYKINKSNLAQLLLLQGPSPVMLLLYSVRNGHCLYCRQREHTFRGKHGKVCEGRSVIILHTTFLRKKCKLWLESCILCEGRGKLLCATMKIFSTCMSR